MRLECYPVIRHPLQTWQHFIVFFFFYPPNNIPNIARPLTPQTTLQNHHTPTHRKRPGTEIKIASVHGIKRPKTESEYKNEIALRRTCCQFPAKAAIAISEGNGFTAEHGSSHHQRADAHRGRKVHRPQGKGPPSSVTSVPYGDVQGRIMRQVPRARTNDSPHAEKKKKKRRTGHNPLQKSFRYIRQ